MKKLVIVGAGFGGIKLALELADNPDFDITIISKLNNFEYNAALYRSATGKSPLEVVIPLRKIFKGYSNISVQLDEITKINSKKLYVESSTGNKYEYDWLVLAVGQVMNYYGIEGLEKYTHSLDTVANTIELRRHVNDVLTRADHKNHHFVVVGAGASGVELAAELQIYSNKLCDKHSTEDMKIAVTLVEAGSRLLPLLYKSASYLTKKRLEKLGVDIRLNRRVVSASEKGVELDSGEHISTDTIVWTAGNINNELLRNHENLFNFGKLERVQVDSYLNASKHIYVMGDSADTKYSGMAQTALHQAKFLAEHFRRKVSQSKLKKYKPQKPIYVVPLGKDRAIMQWGWLVISGYLAWIFRRIADLRLFTYFEPFKDAVNTWKHGFDKPNLTQCPVCLANTAKIKNTDE